jgi:hypothetical protein
MFRSKKAKAQYLMSTGEKAVGTLLGLQDTGMTVNDNPRVKMRFRIEPLDGGAAFEGEKKTTVSRVQIPQPGGRYPVFYSAEDPTQFAVVMGVDENGRAQIAQMFGDVFGAQGEGIGMPAVSSPPVANGGASSSDDAIEKLSKLADLHKAGVLTDEEFAAKKAQLLGTV